MKKDDGKKKKTGAGKPAYEKPVAVPLGELARGFGGMCSMGGNASGSGWGICRDGGGAINCTTGLSVRHT